VAAALLRPRTRMSILPVRGVKECAATAAREQGVLACPAARVASGTSAARCHGVELGGAASRGLEGVGGGGGRFGLVGIPFGVCVGVEGVGVGALWAAAARRQWEFVVQGRGVWASSSCGRLQRVGFGSWCECVRGWGGVRVRMRGRGGVTRLGCTAALWE
jgi:hypothetical protein